jgi:hypothetical protein
VWQVAFPLPFARDLTLTADLPQWTGWFISLYIVGSGWVGEIERVRDLYMLRDTHSYRGVC